MPNKEKQKRALKDWIRTEEQAEKCITSPNSILGNKPESLIGDHEQITPTKKAEPVPGYINTCAVCGLKFIDSTLLRVFPLCPECVEKEHDDSILPQLEAQLYAQNKGFTKTDNGKLQWSLMPFVELEEVVRVLMNGAKTYSPDNWKKCDDVNRYKDALMRHVVSYITGETYDTGKGGDGLHHLAHAVCDCLFLMWFDNQKEDKNA